MNWYKISSKNIKFPISDNLKEDITNISKEIVLSWNNLIESGKIYGEFYDIIFTNPYTNLKDIIRVAPLNRETDIKKVIAQFSPIENIIFVYPKNLILNKIVDKIDNMSINILSSYLIHELTHAIGIKFENEEKRKEINNDFNKTKYYNLLSEFDAYSKQIAYDIEIFLKGNPDKLKDIVNWLRTANLLPIPYFLDSYKYNQMFHVIISTNNIDYIHRLKQRLYNDLRENKYV
jgi:hypothetical protein